MTDDTWIGTPDAAKRLGVTVQDLYRLIDQGRIPAYRFGRIIRLRLAELDEFGARLDGDQPATPRDATE